MNSGLASHSPNGESIFLTQLLGANAYVRDRKIGKLNDLVAVDRGKVAEVTHFQIARHFGDPALLIPLQQIQSFSPREIVLDIQDPKRYVRDLAADEVLLRDYLLDKKVLDIEGREVEVVYDILLARNSTGIYVVDVDISRYGLLVRLGFKRLAAFLYKHAGAAKKRLIPWSYVQPLPSSLGTLDGDLKLNVLREKLSEIHPVDLADILEELDSSQRAVLLHGLDTEHASDTLEEIEPAVQRDIVFSLSKERAAELIAEMTPGQAADVISVLPAAEKRQIMKLLEPEQVAKINEIVEKQDTAILNFASPYFFKCLPETTVAQARAKLRQAAKSMDVVMYFYIVDDSNKLLGVIDIRDVFVAQDTALLKDLMTENVMSVHKDATLKQAEAMFLRYGFRALPVTDENGIMLGVLPHRDVMNLKHRILD